MAKSTRRSASDNDYELEHDRPATEEPDAYPEGQGDPQVQKAAAAYNDPVPAAAEGNGSRVDREITDQVAGGDDT